MPRDSGCSTRTSDSKLSCSSPPPTSTAPTSVSSQSSPARPFVSTSMARNSALSRGLSRTPMGCAVVRLGPDGMKGRLLLAALRGLGRADHRHDLVLHEIAPIGRPLVEQRGVVGLHE